MDEGELIERDVTVTADVLLWGTIIGNVTVRPDSLLELEGEIRGSLYIEPGADVHIRGTVNGNIHNQGALRVSGSVNGTITDDGEPVSYAPGAMINGQEWSSPR